MNTSYVAKMASLQVALTAVDDARTPGEWSGLAWFNLLDAAMSSAWGNARDTVAEGGIDGSKEELARIAYGSICCTSQFERTDVRAWFQDVGYAW